MKRIILLTLFLFFYGNIISQNLNPSSENIIYVKQGAKGTNDGSSWENAYPDLAYVLHWADQHKNRWENKPLQIWIAKGKYHPRYTIAGDGSNNKNRENTFKMVKNVKLYGGFAGNETNIEQRLWLSNQTVLSGDFNNNDNTSGAGASLKFFNNDENAFRVVYAQGDVGNAVLDGFNIVGGHNSRNSDKIEGYGAGIYINGASLELKNLKINRNKADYGAGVAVFSSSPKIGNIWIDKNKGITGAAMYLSGISSGVTIHNSLITDNYGAEAGALRCFNTVNFVNVTIANNHANRHKIGGAVSNRNKVTINFYNSIIYGNTSSGGESSDVTNLSPSISGFQEGQNKVFYYNSYVKEIGNYDSRGRYVSGFGVVGDNEQKNVKGSIKSDLSPLGSNFDLKPQADNQAVNGGDNSYFLPEYGDEDLVGERRIIGANIDLGAFESECIAPIITTQPNAIVRACTGKTITINIAGESVTKYQWQVDKNDNNGFVNLNNDATYSGVTSNNLTVKTSNEINNYKYQVIVEGNCGHKETSNIVSLQIFETTPPAAEKQQTFCNSAKVSDLKAVGENLKWYDASNNVLENTTDLQSGKYFVTQTQNDCESEKVEVSVTVNQTSMPTVERQQTFCNSAKVSDLKATGDGLKWYNTSGMELSLTTDLQSGEYFVTQTQNGCESEKLEVTVTVNKTPMPTADNQQTFCNSAKVSNLKATGENLKWYDASNNVLENTTDLQSGEYFVTQTQNGCESEKLEVKVTVNKTPIPTVERQQTFCNSAKVSDLEATGNDLKWYDASGMELSSTTDLQSGEYFVTQTQNNCESEKLKVAVTVNKTPMPTANTQQTFCNNAKVSDLKASGENLKWYNALGDLLNLTTVLQSGKYFVTQTQNGCESEKLKVAVTVNKTNPPTADNQQTFCNNAKVSDLKATGKDLKWYDTSDNLLNDTTILQSGEYFVTQTLNNCESEKLEVTVTVNKTNPPTVERQQTFCNNAKVSDLEATGKNLKWYNASNIVLEGTTDLQSGEYFVTQTQNDCESEKVEISVIIENVNITGESDVIIGNTITLKANKKMGIWSISNSSLATISPNDNEVIITGILQGSVLVTYELPNGCKSSHNVNILRNPLQCTRLVNPYNHSRLVPVNTELQWEMVEGADGYRISVGTSAGGSEIVENQIINGQNNTSYQFANDLPAGRTIYVRITPFNRWGDAMECSEESFTTIAKDRHFKQGFSPNGDGINDVWEIEAIEQYPNNRVSIFNRWGDMVFYVEGYNNKDRAFRGQANKLTKLGAGKLPEGTYFFIIEIDGKHPYTKLNGSLELRR
ncbi:T9SS type B sorting domain-containing protein [Capnocytophaga felis]|uniref:Ig-like domain-containing protein n=1 Tax=Capnocytophaga felis TaxID=2267611 RepID=A0A5M4BBC9_9FLAO|nr:gliding motility-associated C-terminal domain-containing protein [Capnocytophaga felis]GET46740.1 hypothetical protein RCZ01_20420 [Capnocytophaga felis]